MIYEKQETDMNTKETTDSESDNFIESLLLNHNVLNIISRYAEIYTSYRICRCNTITEIVK